MKHDHIGKLWLCALSTLAALLLPVSLQADPPSDKEQQLRAAMIINILRFTDQRTQQENVFTLCVADSPPSADELLRQTSEGKRRDMVVRAGRPLAVHQLAEGDSKGLQTSHCDAAVVGPEVSDAVQRDLLARAQENGTVVVCDGCQNSDQAHVAVLRRGDRLVFEVDRALAQRADINFSAQLLKLADTVRQ